ncbi:MAG: tetratricopeptide repeat protein, partial [Elainellaceae cyanobacterium]
GCSETVSSPADSIWRRAVTQYDLGEAESAITKLDRLLLASPDDAVVHNMRGLLHDEQQAHKLALDDFTQAIQFASEAGVPLCNRGVLRHKMGDLEGAIADFDRASQLMSDSVIPQFYRGRSWEVSKAYQRALNDYSSVLATIPDTAIALCRRAMVYRQMQQFPQAQQDLNAAAWAFVRHNNSGAARRTLQLLKQWEQDSEVTGSGAGGSGLEPSDAGDQASAILSPTVEHLAS